jgi:hypothetical protein
VVRVKKFTEQHHRVEVDLETGRQKSWMETEEKELIDLCGETPAKKPPVKLEEGDSLKKRNCLKDISNTLPQTSASDDQLNSVNLTFLTYSFLPEQQNFVLFI